MVQLEFDNTNIKHTLYPYVQYKEEATVEIIDNITSFDENISNLNAIISDPIALCETAETYYNSTVKEIKTLYQPYDNRILNKLYRMHLLPSVVSKKKWLFILNYINCEAHRDKQIFTLKTITK